MLVACPPAQAEPAPGKPQFSVPDRGSPFLRFFREGEWYFSVGTSKQYWARTDIHVSQPSQGNDFTIHGVEGHDEPGISSDIFTGDLFGPQYNLRIGRFINDARTIAVEISLDHTKYTSTVGQTANVTGTIGGMSTNANYTLDKNFFDYALHNGANHLMVNAVYRLPLIGETNETLSVAAIAKAGAGIMVPHTSNTILGNNSYVGEKTLNNSFGLHNGWWQLADGWTVGTELGFRVVLYKPIYLELTDKIAYSRLNNLPAYQGTLQHSLLMNEVIFSLGFTYDGTAK